ncbi:hypothetical protein GGR92_003027 [Spirosoma lacussanchae]|uniref:S8/S53 family peptidase n=1 Tax=Spirosoma lacussanchae TaxID=1884249 RepID=UPI001107AD79|nr:S8/S53 family peptidase [Spirosoma lacussanchae]
MNTHTPFARSAMKIYQDGLIIDGDAATLLTEAATERFTPAELAPATSPWDRAHLARQRASVAFAEPDYINHYPFRNPAYDDRLLQLESFGDLGDVCSRNNDYDPHWTYPTRDGRAEKRIWHLGSDFSQLKAARDQINAQPGQVVRIAHLDTGYDPTHHTFPDTIIRHDLERNFIEGEAPDSAVDPRSGGATNQPGHGTGTLSILAGKRIRLDEAGFDDSLGLAEHIEIIPIRIARSVVLFRSRAFVQAMEYIIRLHDDPVTRCHVVTMSMGGLASNAWADVVNEAYERGIFIVSAAGNNFGRATPRTLVYPARFGRVTAACGVTFDGSPYYQPDAPVSLMQGNFGPRRLMDRSIAAFTPNVPWAKIGCDHVVSLAGAGTSAATPQVAAAAALYRLKYFDELAALPGWQQVEATRHALFTSARKAIAPGFDNDVRLYFGNGVLKAADALAIPPAAALLHKTPADVVAWPILSILAGFVTLETMPRPENEEEQMMFETEVQQLIQLSPRLQELLDNEEKQPDDLSPAEQRIFLDTLLAIPEASLRLKAFIQSVTR